MTRWWLQLGDFNDDAQAFSCAEQIKRRVDLFQAEAVTHHLISQISGSIQLELKAIRLIHYLLKIFHKCQDPSYGLMPIKVFIRRVISMFRQ